MQNITNTASKANQIKLISHVKITNASHITRKNITKIRYLKEDACEKSLWKAVICQAIEDATTKSNQPRRKLAKRRALKWITEDVDDFKTVCELAGYNHREVKKNILKIVSEES